MKSKPMKILIIEDDINDCNKFINSVKNREDFEIVAITDSDVEGLKYAKIKHPEGIILDLELNDSSTGSLDSLDFIERLKEMKLNYEPIIIVTTHINSKRTYEILHRYGVDLILYKGHPKYSSDYVLNKFLNLRKLPAQKECITMEEKIQTEEDKISEIISYELNLVGIGPHLKGRDYAHDAILYLIQNPKSNINVIQYLAKVYKKSTNTINNGIQNAIIHGWRVTPVEELEAYYTARINYETGMPTTMEFIYYYVDKIKKMI